jgi:hypothetical protein
MRGSFVRRLSWVVLAALTALPAAAQEPRPVPLAATSFDLRGNVTLDWAWRFAPGDEAARAATSYDDSHWLPVRPALDVGELPAGGWTGIGWFRRHLLVAESLDGHAMLVRLAAPGAAELFFDGQPVLALAGTTGPPGNGAEHAESALLRVTPGRHVLAVRYAVTPDASGSAGGFGFRLVLSDPALASPSTPWQLVVIGATLALPIILALLHLAFFSFDRRARENLYYALEMLAFAAIVFSDSRAVLLQSDVARDRIDLLSRGLVIPAVLFGGLTYYALRPRPWPRSARLFVAVAPVLFVLCYAVPTAAQTSWITYFVALVVDVVRLERGGRVVRREGSRFFVVSFAIFGLLIALQVLVNLGVLQSVAGMRNVYVLGILASAAGMSLYLASTLGRSRILEAENARRAHELARARDLQLSLLPAELPALAGLEIAAVTQTATEVGGDYYDARAAGEDALLIAFGDATGHGLAAGLVVTATKALFGALPPGGAPSTLLATCQQALATMRLPRLRMCLSLARVDRHAVTIASAAMPPVLIWRAADGRVEELGSGGLPLGGRAATAYEEHSATLAVGDVVLFASDGFAELRDAQGGELGYPAVIEALRRAAPRRSAAQIVDELVAFAAAARGERPADDDLTLLIVRVGA